MENKAEIQWVSGRQVGICRLPHNQQAAKLQNGAVVPAEVCALAAGPDAWMRGIMFRCAECKALHTAHNLYSNDVPGLCEGCSEDYFHCEKCDGDHHPDDPCPERKDVPGDAGPPAPKVGSGDGSQCPYCGGDHRWEACPDKSTAIMTLRDQFASAALQGLVSSYSGGVPDNLAHVAKLAYRLADAMLADAMLAERNGTP